MYTQEQVQTALEEYKRCGSVTETVRRLGYPKRKTLYTWLHNEGKERTPRRKRVYINTAEHPRNPPVSVKLDALHRCFESGEEVKSVSEDIGYSRASIYTWRRKYLKGGVAALMNSKDILPGTMQPGDPHPNDQELAALQAQIREMQLEIDLLKETINVIKKDPGIDMKALKNREKAAVVDDLKGKYPLPVLLDQLGLARSSYYYQESLLNRDDKYTKIRQRIREIFEENKERYGYRRIYGVLKNEGIVLSEKVVRRVMQEEGLSVRVRKRRKYSSYAGEISPEVPNILQRDFHAEKPNEKWLTDITEFAIPAGKVYLSPVVDCFDGMLVSWSIGTRPDAVLVNRMLEKAVGTLGKEEHPVLHSDRGCHYRWPGWIERTKNAGLVRSMSKKGCSPDNSACEGFFGRLKNEMFYGKDWRGISIDTFIAILNDYLIWYNEKRIKVSLGYMSPKEYRHSIRLAA